jgi:hypothetical protein
MKKLKEPKNSEIDDLQAALIAFGSPPQRGDQTRSPGPHAPITETLDPHDERQQAWQGWTADAIAQPDDSPGKRCLHAPEWLLEAIDANEGEVLPPGLRGRLIAIVAKMNNVPPNGALSNERRSG